MPERRYDLAGKLLATAIDDAAAQDTTPADALRGTAKTIPAINADRRLRPRRSDGQAR
jgi:hypothetical protein